MKQNNTSPERAGMSVGAKKPAPQKPKDPRGKYRALGIVLLVLVLLGFLLWAAWNAILDHYINKINIVTKETGLEYATGPLETAETFETITEEPDPDHHGELSQANLPLICDTADVLNVLLFATDARGNEAGRSDTMMLVSINSKTKTITYTSFERDTLVEITGHGGEKLTHAHAYGGSELLMQTFRENFNIDVRYYAKVNFYSFIDIVDAMGGLDITMNSDEVSVMNFYLEEINYLLGRPYGTENITPADGTYHLTGAQALGYARNRYTGGSDFARMSRQRNVVDLMTKKAKTLSIGELDHLLDVVLPLITTNMPAAQIKTLVNSVPAYLGYEFQGNVVPQDGKFHYDHVNGMSVVAIDLKANMYDLYEKIYGEPAAVPTVEN